MELTADAQDNELIEVYCRGCGRGGRRGQAWAPRQGKGLLNVSTALFKSGLFNDNARKVEGRQLLLFSIETTHL